MKSPYLQNRNTPKWYRSWTFAILALVFAIVMSPARIVTSRLAVLVVSPVWNVGQFAVHSAESFVAGFKSNQALLSENRTLQTDADLLRERLRYLDVLQGENNDLKSLLSRKRDTIFSSTTPGRLCPPTASAIGAKILLSPAQSYYASMLVDVGEGDEVGRGDAVYSFGDIVLGTVSDVYPSTSRVVLYSAPKVSMSVSLGKAHLSVSAVGDGDGTFIATLPKNVSIEVGDEATVQAEKPALLALVEQIQTKGDAAFKTIYLKSPVSLRTLTWVYVDRQISTDKTPTCLDDTY